MNKFILAVLVSVLTCVVFNEQIGLVKYQEYKDVLSTLVNISSITFAVVGAWIAIVYPQIMGVLIKGDDLEDASDNTQQLVKLLELVLISSSILVAVIILQFLFPVFRGVVLRSAGVGVTKYIFFMFVCFLASLQIFAIFSLIMTNYEFLAKLRSALNKKKIDSIHKKRG